jgi:hypothetical protein
LRCLVVPEHHLPRIPAGQRQARGDHAAIEANQVVIVCGETGSGKTTQLPKIALGMGRGKLNYPQGQGRLIGHTQPRRIAASSVAKRIAEELNTPLGEVVGYKVRFQDRLSRDASVKLMTDGICWPKPRPTRCSRPTTRSSSTRRTSAASTSISCSGICAKFCRAGPT